ncbi:elongation factor G [Abyssisolibacter fermentans]|uniref:elongation factor G n=1 Tax=Abyssisolibacter fermentans TaxID=1766203 RepID=UPI000836C6C5|nr:elongation factor G [Abyssisolibacter fermentans]
MKNYGADKIRNVALLGHGGSGKTTLTEALLFSIGSIKRMGKVEEGTTISDYTKQEKDRQVSISTSLIPIEWQEHKFNVLDTPGYFDFIGEVYSALKVVRGAVIVVDASAGIEVGTEKSWKYTRERNLPTIIFVNKMDKENVNIDKIINELREKFGKSIVPFQMPIGSADNFKGLVNIADMKAKIFEGKKAVQSEVPADMMDQVNPFREMLVEAVAESNDELLEKYFEGEEFTIEEIHKGLREGVLQGKLIPILCGSCSKEIGMNELLNLIYEYMPSPADEKKCVGVNPNTEEEVERKIDTNEPFSAMVFKTIADPYVGQISLFKVVSGEVKKDDEVLNTNKDEKEKMGTIFVLRGKEQIEMTKMTAGDIGAVAKLNNTNTGDTLCSKDAPIKFDNIEFPQPTLFMAAYPVSKVDEDKMGPALQRLKDEDVTFSVNRDKETKELLVGGQGYKQIEVIKSKLKDIFGVNIELQDPKIAYRETIKGTSDVQGKHKKQSGGAGQYGDVYIKFAPSNEVFEFEEKIFGGSVPRNYIPAVEKGLRDCVKKGVLAGYPVVNIKATLYDGSYHPVDSNEMAFRMAASIAFKKGVEKAKPILLEPIMKVAINIPEEYMGDIMGDMNKRRGKILGMEQLQDGSQLVAAEAPMSEMFKYTIDLKSMTQARGSFTMEFERYDEIPANLSEKIIEEAKAEKE